MRQGSPGGQGQRCVDVHVYVCVYEYLRNISTYICAYRKDYIHTCMYEYTDI